MPTIFIFFGFRFMFYSNDHQPVHVHVIKDGCEAKYNVNPIEQVYNHGFKKHDIALRWVLKIPTANYNYFNGLLFAILRSLFGPIRLFVQSYSPLYFFTHRQIVLENRLAI